jgi:hypothetical protein
MPTRVVIQQVLKEMLTAAGPNDQVLVAFSMHGVLLDDISYLCPFEADMDRKKETLLPVTVLYDTLQGARVAEKVLVFDACRSPVAMNRGMKVEPLGSAFAQALQAAPRDVVVLSSCDAGEKSYEHNALQHGVFFHFLLKGLKGEADTQRKRSVNVGEVFDYAQSETVKYVRAKFNDAQTPQIYCTKPSDPRSIVLARLDAPRPPEGQIPEPIRVILEEGKLEELTPDEQRTLVVSNLARVALHVAESGERNRARFIMDRAIEIADKVEKARNLADIAKAFAGAKEFLQALIICKKITDKPTQCEAICAVARAQATVGEVISAMVTISLVAEVKVEAIGEFTKKVAIKPRPGYEDCSGLIIETYVFCRKKL